MDPNRAGGGGGGSPLKWVWSPAVLNLAGLRKKMDTSFFVRRSSSACSLNFPRPHQLGISTGIQPSTSSRSSFLPSDSALSESSAVHGTEEVDSAAIADAGPPPAKKIALSKKREKPTSYKPGAQLKPIVKTYDEKPLREFSLFLPERVPRSILQSRSAIQDFVLSTTATYLSLWELSSKMDALELRIPPLYVDQLCDDGDFLTKFLAEVFGQISYVKSIQELILPRIMMHPRTQLEAILKPLVDSKCSISHLYIPVTCSLRSKDLEGFNFKSLATFLRKSPVQELTFVSKDGIVEEISKKVEGELKKTKKCTIQVHFSERDLGAPGPDYIAELKETATMGECVDPHVLVSSLNAHTAAVESTGQGAAATKKSAQKSVSMRFLSEVIVCWVGYA